MNISGLRLTDRGYERLARCWVKPTKDGGRYGWVEVVLKRSLDGTYRVETRTDTAEYLGEPYEAAHFHLLDSAATYAAVRFNRLAGLSMGV